MHDHVNYARTGPGAAKGIQVLSGSAVFVEGYRVAIEFVAANKRQTVWFYSQPDEDFKLGQAVEITIASFDDE
jgi:hypothetical protein